VLLLVAVVWLVLDGRNGGGSGAGELLVPFEPELVDRVRVRHESNVYDIVREGEQWLLRGTVHDWATAPVVEDLVRRICRLTGNAELDGSDPDDAGYGFSRPEGFSVLVGTREGRETEIRFGILNPITESFYAAGAGRDAVFTVDQEARATFAELPNSVRLHSLLPAFDRSLADTVWIERRGVSETLLLIRHAGRWWLRQPAAGVSRLGTRVRGYHALYDDRRETRDGATWLLADPAQVKRMLFEISETGLAGFGPPRHDDRYLERVGLLPPLRRIRCALRDGRTLAIAFGDVQDNERAAALRHDPPCLVEAQDFALTTALVPTSELVHTGAFPFLIADADSFRITHEAQHLLSGLRGLEQWIGVPRAGVPENLLGETIDNITGDLASGLTTLDIEEVLPPPNTLQPLVPTQRTVWHIWFSGAVGTREVELRFGRLPDGRAAVYYPQTGVLLRVDAGILTSFRSLFVSFDS